MARSRRGVPARPVSALSGCGGAVSTKPDARTSGTSAPGSSPSPPASPLGPLDEAWDCAVLCLNHLPHLSDSPLALGARTLIEATIKFGFG